MSNNKTRIVIMGCGGSGGVPYAGNVWRQCDPANPKNHRTRPSVYIEKNDTRIVIDTGPEFRLQLNRTGITEDQMLNAVLYTHTHFDHIMGLDDLRTFWHRSGKVPIPVYGSEPTLDELVKRFDYAFNTLNPQYPPIVKANLLTNPLTIGDLTIQNFDQIHGDMTTNGFRIGDFGYSTDVNELPEAALKTLKGVKVWVVGAFHTDESVHNHAGLNKVKEWVDILKPDMTYLTHLTANADYNELCAKLPPHIRPAYDGLEFLL
jgi:phosphoribosyl 1,2-cyclic phosphate phosphodiesterase